MYLTALSDREYDIIYQMTPDADLMRLSRKLSRRDFAERVEGLLGGEEMEIEEIELERVAQRGETCYFRAAYPIGLGVQAKSPVWWWS